MPRRILLIAAGTGAALALLVLIARALFPEDKVKALALARVEQTLGVAPTLEGSRATLFPPGVELRGLRIANPAGPEYPPLAELAAAGLSVRVFPLLLGRVELGRATLDSLRLVLVLGPDGKPVLPRVERRPGGGAPPEPGAGWKPAVLLSGARIRNASLRILDPASGAETSIGRLENELALGVTDRGRRIDARGRLAASDIRSPQLLRAGYRDGFPELTLEYDLGYLPRQGEAEIRRLRVGARSLSLDLAGSAKGLPAAPAVELRLETPRIELADLFSLMPPAIAARTMGLQGSGPLSLAGEATLSPPNPPVYRVTLTLSGLSARLPQVSEGLDDLRGVIEVNDRAASVQGFSCVLGGRRVTIEGSVTDYRAPVVDLALDGELDLGAVGRARLLPPGSEAAGELAVHLTALGPVKQPQGLELGGHLTLAGVAFTSAAKAGAAPIALRGGNGRARFERNAVILESFRCILNESPLELSGRLEDPAGEKAVSLQVKARRLDLDRFLPPPPPEGAGGDGAPPAPPSAVLLLPPIPDATLELAAEADTLTTMGHLMTGVRLKSRVVRGAGGVTLSMAHGIFKGVDVYRARSELTLGEAGGDGRPVPALRGTVVADSATAYRRLLLTRAAGDVLITSDGRIEVSSLRAAAHGGQVEGSVEVLVKGPRQVDFSYRADAAGMDADDFLSRFTPAKDVLHGELSLRSSWAGSGTTPEAIARTLTADGDFNVAEGRLENVAALRQLAGLVGLEETAAVAFRSLAGAFQVKEGRLITPSLLMQGRDGEWRIGGSVGFDGTLDYDVALALSPALAAKLRAPPGLSGLLADEQGRVLFDFEVSGTARDPAVKADAAKTSARAKGKVAALLEEAVKKGDGKKLLEGLLKKRP